MISRGNVCSGTGAALGGDVISIGDVSSRGWKLPVALGRAAAVGVDVISRGNVSSGAGEGTLSPSALSRGSMSSVLMISPFLVPCAYIFSVWPWWGSAALPCGESGGT